MVHAVLRPEMRRFASEVPVHIDKLHDDPPVCADATAVSLRDPGSERSPNGILKIISSPGNAWPASPYLYGRPVGSAVSSYRHQEICAVGYLRIVIERLPSETSDHTVVRGSRVLAALDAISSALCATTQGPAPLLRALAEAGAASLPASWVAIAFTEPVFLHQAPPVVVRRPDGTVVNDWTGVPARIGTLVARILGTACPVGQFRPKLVEVSDVGGLPRLLGAAMCHEGEPVGVVAVQIDHGEDYGDVDRAILTTLADHGALALENAFSFQERERLRRVAEVAGLQAFEQARALARRDRELHLARESLDRLRQRQAVDAERQRIAAELHDSVAQNLLASGVTLRWCCQQMSADDPLRPKIDEACRLAGVALEEVRTAIFHLSPMGPSSSGLTEALAYLAESVSRSASIRPTTRLAAVGRLPVEVERAVYYIAEELLFNVVKHAGGTRFWLTLGRPGGWLHLTVSDNGRGNAHDLASFFDEKASFSEGKASYLRRGARHGRGSGTERTFVSRSPADAETIAHRGLSHVAWRAASLGGEVLARDRAGGGVRLQVRIPLGPIHQDFHPAAAMADVEHGTTNGIAPSRPE